MNPEIATLACGAVILGLFYLDREGRSGRSVGLWIATVWLCLACSRMVSQWLAAASVAGGIVASPDQLLEGSPLDRYILLSLLGFGLIVLLSRHRQVREVLGRNAPILVFFAYCGISALWSEYIDVSLKRWTKALGDLVMILIVLSERDRMAAIERLLARLAFVLIPVSILLIKYFPDLGRDYSPYTGDVAYTGVTANKNQLGYICLLLGLASGWRVIDALRQRRGIGSRARILLAHSIILAMVFWLFSKASSMTSFASFLMASTIVLAGSLGLLQRGRWRVHALIGSLFVLAASVVFLEVGSGMVVSMGRDPTLTGRSDIWRLVLGMAPNPMFGAGFESFWLGKRLQEIWRVYWWHPVQSHNGYIDIYLNLGGVGISILVIVLIAAYRNVVADFRREPRLNCLRLSYLVAAVAYNFTESAFVMLHPVWIFLLLSAVNVRGGWSHVKLETRAPFPSSSEPELSIAG